MSKSLYSNEQKNIANKLTKARMEAKLTQSAAAIKLQKSQSYISKVESGQRLIDIVELKQFARLYSKKLSYFMEGL